jgi:hypothetical protein
VRRILLWFAGNAWLRRHVPRWWFARRAVRRSMPGETADEALAAAERFRENGVGTLFTHLGENVTNPAEAAAATEGYAALQGSAEHTLRSNAYRSSTATAHRAPAQERVTARTSQMALAQLSNAADAVRRQCVAGTPRAIGSWPMAAEQRMISQHLRARLSAAAGGAHFRSLPRA